MNFFLPIQLPELPVRINYRDKIMLTGSCFTEHIGNALMDLKFDVLQNPNGILFGADAVCQSLSGYIDNRVYTDDDLFYLNEMWSSWHHHSRFSDLERSGTLEKINKSQQEAHNHLKHADWLIITLGSSFSYCLTDKAQLTSMRVGERVANCHRAPANWFTKQMIGIYEMQLMLSESIKRLKEFNPALKIIFTISPVRHIRDGVVENNRSKARLIETVHSLTAQFDNTWYFPAYELVIDVLRDYRFYDVDLVHPNYPATEFVLEKFATTSIDADTRKLMEEVRSIIIARRHKPFQPGSNAHRQFLSSHAAKAKSLMQQYPFLNLRKEVDYFEK